MVSPDNQPSLPLSKKDLAEALKCGGYDAQDNMPPDFLPHSGDQKGHFARSLANHPRGGGRGPKHDVSPLSQ